MISLVIAIPVLARPQNAAKVAASARASIPGDRVRILFLCSPGDDEEIAACFATGEDVIVVPWECGPGDWAKKHNYAYERMCEEWIFLGADDLHFHGGWLDACLAENDRYSACVIGTNDLGNSRTKAGYHSTHTLVHADYLACGGVADDPTRILCERYDHQYVDDEFIQTAISRETYRHASNAWVEHLHPNWGKAADDATYRKGAARFDADRRLYEARKGMWLPGPGTLQGSRRRG